MDKTPGQVGYETMLSIMKTRRDPFEPEIAQLVEPWENQSDLLRRDWEQTAAAILAAKGAH